MRRTRSTHRKFGRRWNSISDRISFRPFLLPRTRTKWSGCFALPNDTSQRVVILTHIGRMESQPRVQILEPNAHSRHFGFFLRGSTSTVHGGIAYRGEDLCVL